MQEGNSCFFSFSGIDIGFRSITFADADVISLEYILLNTGQGIGAIIRTNTVRFVFFLFFFFFFFFFFISNGWHLNQATHRVLEILVKQK